MLQALLKHYVHLETDLHLYCTHGLYSSKSKIQMIRMDDRIDKHSAKGLRIDVQWTTANISAGEVEKLLLSCASSSFCNRRIKKTDLKLIRPSLSWWSDLTLTKGEEAMQDA